MFPGVDQAAGFAANLYFQASPVAYRIFPNLLGLAVELTGSMRDRQTQVLILACGCEFRGRLIAGGVETLLLDILLKQFKEKGIVKDKGKQRTDSTYVHSSNSLSSFVLKA